MTTDDKMVVVTLALTPISVAASVALWLVFFPAAAFMAPTVAACLAPIAALEYKRVRNIAWGALAVQVAVMLLVALA